MRTFFCVGERRRCIWPNTWKLNNNSCECLDDHSSSVWTKIVCNIRSDGNQTYYLLCNMSWITSLALRFFVYHIRLHRKNIFVCLIKMWKSTMRRQRSENASTSSLYIYLLYYLIDVAELINNGRNSGNIDGLWYDYDFIIFLIFHNIRQYLLFTQMVVMCMRNREKKNKNRVMTQTENIFFRCVNKRRLTTVQHIPVKICHLSCFPTHRGLHETWQFESRSRYQTKHTEYKQTKI